MAGLSANIVRSKNKEMPLFPRAELGDVYSTMGQGYSQYYYFPAFSGGTAGRSIRIRYSGYTTDLQQYNADGSAVTDGVWNGGMTVDEASGSANTENFLNYYMDDADNKLYILTSDTGTSPHTLYLSSVNEAGTVTAIGNAQVGNASMNNLSVLSGTAGAMYRAGGDGSGNFQIPCFLPAGGNSASAVPYRGAMVTINITNGALSYADLLPSTYANSYSLGYGYAVMGPTANNILVQVYYLHSGTDRMAGHYGQIYNLTTGKFGINLTFAGNAPWGTGIWCAQRWRGKYHFPNNTMPYGKSIGAYSEADIHNWCDEMAVFYGLL